MKTKQNNHNTIIIIYNEEHNVIVIEKNGNKTALVPERTRSLRVEFLQDERVTVSSSFGTSLNSLSFLLLGTAYSALSLNNCKRPVPYNDEKAPH